MSHPTDQPTRRAFLGVAGSAVAAGVLHAGSDEPAPVKVAVIGTGARGSDLIRALTTIDGVELAGVCDDYAPHLAQGAKYAGPRAKAFADYKAMLEKLRPQAVVIAVPLVLHYRIASDALAAGCNVFLEKTMCYRIDEARRLAKQVAAAKRVFQVGLQRRANPIYKQAAAMVETGMIGQITAIKAQWHRHNSWRRPVPKTGTDAERQALERRLNWRLYRASSAGLMAELGSHQLDIANWLLGTTPRRVIATGGIDFWRDGRDVIDNIFCVYEYEIHPPARAKSDEADARPKPYSVRVTYSSLCNNAYEGAAELILGTKGSLYLTASKGLLFREPGADKVNWAADKGKGDAEANAAVVTSGKTLKLTNDPWAYRGKPTEIDIEAGNDTRDELVSFIDHARRHDADTLVDAKAGLLNAVTVLIANQGEPHITLLLDTAVFAAAVKDGLIQTVMARCDRTEHLYQIKAKIFCDCTGDSRLGLEAGAAMRIGHEARKDFGESLAPKVPDKETQGCSILFTARDYGKPMPFTPPRWARKITAKNLRFRSVKSWEYGYWWIEWGGQMNTVRDNERIRFELLSIVLGVWDHIKNSDQLPASANWALDWVGMLPGKREARRLVGDHVLTQNDVMGLNGDFADAVCIGGWGLDEHPPTGFDDPEKPPFVAIKLKEVYNIPLRSLYCKDIKNLLMAGRNISATHVAFTSTRVMGTCAVEGQAVGTAAALCVRHQLQPRDLARDKARLKNLQQTLLRDDQTIKGRKNEDPADLARHAKVTASAAQEGAAAAHVINGWVRDVPGQFDNKWAAPLGAEGAWIELAWQEPQSLRRVQITFDSGFHRELTLSSSNDINKGIIRSPQPETVKDYTLYYRAPDGKQWIELAKVAGNHQRLRRHEFKPAKAQAVRIHVHATNGDKLARIFEVRCYS
jgi:predicted dehydrogenase